jgi:hypothetical protein
MVELLSPPATTTLPENAIAGSCPLLFPQDVLNALVIESPIFEATPRK